MDSVEIRALTANQSFPVLVCRGEEVLVVGWLSTCLAALSVPPLLGYQLYRHALPKRECSDFCAAGSPSGWDMDVLAKLTGPVGLFVRQVSAESNVALRVDLICERLAEVDIETRRIPERMTLLARVTLASGAMVAIMMVVQALHGNRPVEAIWALVPMVVSAAGVFWCHWMGRLASSGSNHRRRNWDALSALLLRPHMTGRRFGGGIPNHRSNDGSCSDVQRIKKRGKAFALLGEG